MVFSELIAAYLFLGGTAAGAFAVFASLELGGFFARRRDGCVPRIPIAYSGHRRISPLQAHVGKIVYAASFALLVVGMLCLLADLGRPEAFLLLFLHPSGSLVTVGSFALAGLTVCMLVVLSASVLTLPLGWDRVSPIAKALGVAASFVVMAYTGLLLESVVAVAVWQSWWLPALFVFSALSCGCGVVLLSMALCEGGRRVVRWVRPLALADVAFIAGEAVCAIGLALAVNASDSARPFDALLVGGHAPAFWLGFVVCGMLAPLVVELAVLRSPQGHRPSLVAIAAVLVLAGGACLRLVLVAAGVQPAL